MSIAIQKLNHFAYRCKDAEETRHFYEDILGLPLYHIVRAENVPSTGEHNPFCHLFFKMNDGSCVAFFDLGDDVAPQPSPNTPAWVNHLALEVATHDELLAFKKKLESHGIDVLGPTDHRTMDSIYFFDPNGLRVELACWKVSMAQMDEESKRAHAMLDEWTAKKRAQNGA